MDLTGRHLQDDEPLDLGGLAGRVEVLHECVSSSSVERLLLADERRGRVEIVVSVGCFRRVQVADAVNAAEVEHAFHLVLLLDERRGRFAELLKQRRHCRVELRSIRLIWR